jgi:hypothetical protein
MYAFPVEGGYRFEGTAKNMFTPPEGKVFHPLNK